MMQHRLLTLLVVFAVLVTVGTACGESRVRGDAASSPGAEASSPMTPQSEPSTDDPTEEPAAAGHAPCPSHWTRVPLDVSAPWVDLRGVDALSRTDAWVVGNEHHMEGGSYGPPFVRRWDGVGWATTPLNSPEGVDWHTLEDVVAIAPNDAWAVGNVLRESATAPQAMRWDGSAWSPVATPSPRGPGSMTLRGVDAVSASDVWAVGHSSRYGATASYALIEHWDGQKWTLVRSPDVLRDNGLYDVAALSETNVWAVGETWIETRTGEPLILRWDGTTWSSMPVPPVPGRSAVLTDVAAVAVDDVWAVGKTVVGMADEPVILHWDGAQWSRVIDRAERGNRQLVGVSASASDVWAVGGIMSGTALVQHLDGHYWARNASLDLPRHESFLMDVASAPDGAVWAVGNALTNPIVMRFCPVR